MNGLPLDRETVARLYEAHAALLVGYVCTLVGDRATAQDLVHELFVRLLRGGVAIAGPPLPYLCRAVRNAALNDRRARARDVTLDDGISSWLAAPERLGHLVITVETALGRLPAEQREVIVLRIWGGLTLQEVSDVVGVPLNTVASRYRYGAAKLREILQPCGVLGDGQ